MHFASLFLIFSEKLQKLENYKNAGINRISIGLQSTHNRILNLIGRIHTYEEFLNTYNMAKDVGFKNINVDLMLAIPTQTEEELIKSVQDVIDLKPNHISLYSLILEDGTELEKLVSKNELELLDEDIERTMYWKTKELLGKVNEVVQTASGHVVYLDKSQKHMYELNNKVRLINVMDYPVSNCDEFLGFISGILS